MPELPEVETVKNTLKQDIIGKTIDHIDIYYGKIIKNLDPKEFQNKLIGETFLQIYRFGKYLVFELNHCFLVAHLRMEGKYFLMKDEPLNKHDHIIYYFKDGTNLRYNDVRKFGIICLFLKDKYGTIDNIRTVYPLNQLGLEPFDKGMTVDYLKNKFKKLSLPIKSALLDQSIIAGLGNIYADEVCYYASLHPSQSVETLNDIDLQNIIESSIKVLNKAIQLGGTTIRSFQSSHEISGRFQNELCVHTKEYCVCGEKILKIRIGGRGTYYCPKCQILRGVSKK